MYAINIGFKTMNVHWNIFKIFIVLANTSSVSLALEWLKFQETSQTSKMEFLAKTVNG